MIIPQNFVRNDNTMKSRLLPNNRKAGHLREAFGRVVGPRGPVHRDPDDGQRGRDEVVARHRGLVAEAGNLDRR